MFAKIFTQIFDSSIVEDPEARFTFMDLLVLADANGVVDMTHEAIARRTNRAIEIIRRTILQLEGPDARSRTPDADGRRIVRLDEHRDWGWMIINYDRFREIASEEQRREKTLNRVRKHRNKTRENIGDSSSVTQCNAGVTQCNAGNAMQKQKQKQMEKKTHNTERVSDFNKQEAQNRNGELDPVFVLDLMAVYRRPAGSRLSYAEQSSLAQIIRERPRYREEWDTIIVMRQKEPRYFPQSLSRLLSAWQETLDRAMNWTPDSKQPKTIADRLMKELDSIK